jgi:hypothetical protein
MKPVAIYAWLRLREKFTWLGFVESDSIFGGVLTPSAKPRAIRRLQKPTFTGS